jgi:hypothetical protein
MIPVVLGIIPTMPIDRPAALALGGVCCRRGLRAERKIGELTKRMPKASPDRKSKSDGPTLIPPKQSALAAAGISKQDASEYERLAEVPGV